jgi:hypothetical protein
MVASNAASKEASKEASSKDVRAHDEATQRIDGCAMFGFALTRKTVKKWMKTLKKGGGRCEGEGHGKERSKSPALYGGGKERSKSPALSGGEGGGEGGGKARDDSKSPVLDGSKSAVPLLPITIRIPKKPKA